MPLRRLGTVTRLAQGLVVVRADGDDGPPDLGTSVVDESLSTVGRVVDVFGPVERPYLAVHPTDGVDGSALVGAPVYAR